MILILNIILLTLAAVSAYTWGGFYLLLKWSADSARRKNGSGATGESFVEAESPLPHISIIIAAYNEETVIADRINNLKQLNYPAESITVYVGCDGCADATAEAARKAAGEDERFNIHEYSQNRGKVTVLKELVCGAAADRKDDPVPYLLVFSDANTMFAKDAVNRLVRHFSDETVGGVCGRLAFVSGDNENENPAEEGAYWRIETRLKIWESEIDSCLGANGAIYAIRPDLFWHEIPENTIVDDLVIGMKVREQGFRMLYDTEAVAVEELPQVSDEWVRRVRIGCGDYQAIGLCRKCLGFGFGRFALIFWSHKILRWMTPHIMLVMFIMSWGLSLFSLLYKDFTLLFMPAYAVAVGFTLFLIAGVAGRRMRQKGQSGMVVALCSVCDHFLTMHAALFAGFIRFCSGNASGSWTRTPRS